MSFCQKTTPLSVCVAVRTVVQLPFCIRILLSFLTIVLLMPFCGEAKMLVLSRVHFPDTLRQQPGVPQFGPAPAPWLIAVEVEKSAPAEERLDARVMAKRFVEAAAVPLPGGSGGDAESGDAGLASLGKPVTIRVILPDETGDDGTAAYLMVSSMFLFGSSSLLGYFTRRRLAYSLSDEPLAPGGRPSLPPLLLPPAAIRS